jgi:hypothetical protein
MSRPSHQAGMTRAKTLLAIVAVLGVYGAFTFAPPYIRDFQLAHAFDEEAKSAHLRTDEELRRSIATKLDEIGLGDLIDPKDIVIERNADNTEISVYTEYDVELELVPGKVITLHFAPEVDRPVARQ